MLRVTIELVPFGNEEEAKVIGEMIVANVSGVSHNAEYVSAYHSDLSAGIAMKTARHDRRDDVWTLIKRVLNSREYGVGDKYAEILPSRFKFDI